MKKLVALIYDSKNEKIVQVADITEINSSSSYYKTKEDAKVNADSVAEVEKQQKDHIYGLIEFLTKEVETLKHRIAVLEGLEEEDKNQESEAL